MAFALIANGTVAHIDAAEFPVAAPFVWVDVTAVSPAPQVGWVATETGGTWSFAAPPAPAVPPANYPALAQAALDKSDVTILRCYEHSVAVPADWTAYRATLRGIRGGAVVVTEMPVEPAFPAGT